VELVVSFAVRFGFRDGARVRLRWSLEVSGA
jgi:hypothetical protein